MENFKTSSNNKLGASSAFQILCYQADSFPLISQTALQRLFTIGSVGGVNLKGFTSYLFECSFSLSGLSTTNGTFSFGFLGTAAFTLNYRSVANKNVINSPATGMMTTFTTNSSSIISNVSTVSQGQAFIKGIVRTTTAGTLIPGLGLSIASAPVVLANSYFLINEIGAFNFTTNGNFV